MKLVYEHLEISRIRRQKRGAKSPYKASMVFVSTSEFNINNAAPYYTVTKFENANCCSIHDRLESLFSLLLIKFWQTIPPRCRTHRSPLRLSIDGSRTNTFSRVKWYLLPGYINGFAINIPQVFKSEFPTDSGSRRGAPPRRSFH